MSGTRMNRRELLKVVALAGGGLVLELRLSGPAAAAEATTVFGSRELNAYIQISPSGAI